MGSGQSPAALRASSPARRPNHTPSHARDPRPSRRSASFTTHELFPTGVCPCTRSRGEQLGLLPAAAAAACRPPQGLGHAYSSHTAPRRQLSPPPSGQAPRALAAAGGSRDVTQWVPQPLATPLARRARTLDHLARAAPRGGEVHHALLAGGLGLVHRLVEVLGVGDHDDTLPRERARQMPQRREAGRQARSGRGFSCVCGGGLHTYRRHCPTEAEKRGREACQQGRQLPTAARTSRAAAREGLRRSRSGRLRGRLPRVSRTIAAAYGV